MFIFVEIIGQQSEEKSEIILLTRRSSIQRGLNVRQKMFYPRHRSDDGAFGPECPSKYRKTRFKHLKRISLSDHAA